MLQIGKINRLQAFDTTPFGFFLGTEEQAALLLNGEVPDDFKMGDWLDVFVYHDKDDRLRATAKMPKVMADQCAYLKVVAISNAGAFVDWGMDKDLLVPYSEQDKPMEEGNSYVVYVYYDEQTERLVASSHLRDFLYEKSQGLQEKQQVDLLICARTDMGFKAVINGDHLGLIFKDEVFKPIKVGHQFPGYVKHIREDGRIDLCFQFHDHQAKSDLESRILADLQSRNGVSDLTDKSDPVLISKRFNVSKGAYKKALGALFKEKKILLSKTEIKLAE